MGGGWRRERERGREGGGRVRRSGSPDPGAVVVTCRACRACEATGCNSLEPNPLARLSLQ